MKRQDGFPDDFIWGCSTSSYQIEGAAAEGGKGPSIWDTFAHTPGKVAGGHNGDVACDSFHRWNDDISLLKELNAGAYRFSVSWPRIQPEGKGAPNQAGLDYYSRLVDALAEAGIEPWLELFHWDLPQALEEAGGWRVRDTALRFEEYASIMYGHIGDRVRHWTSMNEPWCAAFLGHLVGDHAPGMRDRVAATRAVHHLLLAHGLAARDYRRSGLAGEYGLVINPNRPRPATLRAEDVDASELASIERTSLWLDPVFGRGYPAGFAERFGEDLPTEPGDMDVIASPLDFIGVNYYNEEAVRAADPTGENPYGFEFVPTYQKKTEMDWEIEPQGLRRILEHIAGNWPCKALYVTENGAAFPDIPGSDGIIRDYDRIAYLEGHIEACREALSHGVPLKGYFVWSLLDNFEWSFGYTKKFGLASVDPADRKRRPKLSFYYYRDRIAGFCP
jgi:beta-glucosidase